MDESSVAHTGHSPEDVAGVLREVIARHNESIIAPKLYFAGFIDSQWDPMGDFYAKDFPAGITISSYQCDLIDPKFDGAFCLATTHDGVHACASNKLNTNNPNLPFSAGWVVLLPTDCPVVDSPPNKWTLTDTPDLAQVMTHEIGHTLGLGHTNQSKAECESSGGIHGGPIDGANGVMQTAAPALFPAYRSWRRDDLEGLVHLYESMFRPHEIAWWDDDAYPNYPEEFQGRSLVDMAVSRPAVVSNREASPQQALVTTAPSGAVLHRIMESSGEVIPTNPGDALVDPSPAGRTWATPAVALGRIEEDDIVFVAWFANEVQTTTLGDLRVGVRHLQSADWNYVNHPDPIRVNRLVAGFVPASERFVVVTLTALASELSVILFDGSGASLGPAITLDGIRAFDVGPPDCADNRCLIPFSAPVFSGPDFSVVEVEISDTPLSIVPISQQSLQQLDTRGRLGLADGANGLTAAIGPGRLRLGTYPDLLPATTLEDFDPTWPLAASAWRVEGLDQGRLLQPRQVMCGNGIVQFGEECDDHNMIEGDGCSECKLEMLGDESGDESGDAGGDEVGAEGPGLGEDGCSCGTSGPGPSTSTLVWLLSLLGLRRLRPRRAHRHAPAQDPPPSPTAASHRVVGERS